MAISSYTKAGVRSLRGNMFLVLTEEANILDAEMSNGEVTNMTMAVGSEFHIIEADIDTIIRDETLNEKDRLISYVRKITFEAGKLRLENSVLSEALMNAGRVGISAIVVDNNERGWLVGYHPDPTYLGTPLHLGTDSYESTKGVRHFELQTEATYKDLPLGDALSAAVLYYLRTGQTIVFTGDPLVTSDGYTLVTDTGEIIITR